MDPLTVSIITKALDGLAMRAASTAQNVANSGSPGYRPTRVGFESALREAARAGPDAVKALKPEFLTAVSGELLRTDLELATASQTSLRYSALIDILGRQLQLSRAALSGGRS